MALQTLSEIREVLLRSAERFAVYDAQQTLIEQAAKGKMKEGLDIIKTLISQDGCPGLVHRGLETYRYLLAKDKSVFTQTTEELGPLLLKSVREGLWVEKSCTDDMIVFEIISVSLKISKFLMSRDEEEASAAERFMVTLLTEDSAGFITVLFKTGPKYFVKRKLLKFLCHLMECHIWNYQKMTAKVVTNLGVILLEKLKGCTLKAFLSQPGQTEFIGHLPAGCNTEQRSGLDAVYLREWTYVCICAVATVNSVSGSDLQDLTSFMKHLDSVVGDLLKTPSSHLFPWLPDIYGDQDDLWVKVLILLLDLLTSFEIHYRDLHLQFLQFVSLMGYDDLALVDLLTSPETKFREYFVKYLKFLASTWTQFMECTLCFSQINEVEETSDLEDLHKGSYTIEEMSTDDESDCNTNLEATMSATGTSHSEAIVENHHQNQQYNVKIVGNCIKEYCEDMAVGKELNDNGSMLKGGESVSRNEKDIETGSKAIGVPKFSGLSLIMNTYDNESDTDTSNSLDNDLHTGVEDIQECNNRNHLYVLERSDGSIKYKNVNVKPPGNDHVLVPQRKITADVSHSLYKYDQQHVGEKAKVHENISTSENSDTLIDKETEVISVTGDEVLDMVMGMLIRVRLKLERLASANLLLYNPEVLILLLESVESRYELN